MQILLYSFSLHQQGWNLFHKFSRQTSQWIKEQGFYNFYKVISYLCFNEAVDAATGYLVDMKMYKAPDYRCLKPKPGLPSSQWPHYDMEQHRAAKSIEELNKVDEIPFDKESLFF